MSNSNPNTQNEWLTKERVLEYLSKANNIPHRTEGESVLLENIPYDLDPNLISVVIQLF